MLRLETNLFRGGRMMILGLVRGLARLCRRLDGRGAKSFPLSKKVGRPEIGLVAVFVVSVHHGHDKGQVFLRFSFVVSPVHNDECSCGAALLVALLLLLLLL